MIDEIITNIINNTINSFDIPFCISVNIATYITINIINNKKTVKLNTWYKRLVFLIISILIAIFYCANGSDYRTILNSFILAPVSWSWIFKPICSKFKIDYKSKNISNRNL